MNKSRIKDLQAAGIVLFIISVPVGVLLISEYASRETKQIIGTVVIGVLSLALIFTIWKAIRLLID